MVSRTTHTHTTDNLTGYLLNLPATQFPVHSYEPYAIDVRGRILVSMVWYQAYDTCYVSFYIP